MRQRRSRGRTAVLDEAPPAAASPRRPPRPPRRAWRARPPTARRGCTSSARPEQALVFDGKGGATASGCASGAPAGGPWPGSLSTISSRAYYQGTTIQPAVAPRDRLRVLLDPAGASRRGDVAHLRAGRALGAGDGRRQARSKPRRGGARAERPQRRQRHPATPSSPRMGHVRPKAALPRPLVLRPLDAGTAPPRRFVVAYKTAGAVPGRPEPLRRLPRRDDPLPTERRPGDGQPPLPAGLPQRGGAGGDARFVADEALKAQVLAARTYAVPRQGAAPGERFDVDDTTQLPGLPRHKRGAPERQRPDRVNAGRDHRPSRAADPGLLLLHLRRLDGEQRVHLGRHPLPYLRGIQDADPAVAVRQRRAAHAWSDRRLTAAQLEVMLNEDATTAIGRPYLARPQPALPFRPAPLRPGHRQQRSRNLQPERPAGPLQPHAPAGSAAPPEHQLRPQVDDGGGRRPDTGRRADADDAGPGGDAGADRRRAAHPRAGPDRDGRPRDSRDPYRVSGSFTLPRRHPAGAAPSGWPGDALRRRHRA